MAKKQLTIEEKLQAALVPVEEQPYKVPENWCWVRLGSVTTRIKRGKSPKYVDESEFPVFAQKCNQKDGTIALEKARFLNPDMAMKLSEEEFLHENDVVINSTGTGTLGRVGFFREQDKLSYEKILPDSHVTVVRPSTVVENFFLYLFLKGKQSFLELQGTGSTNQKELRPAMISELMLPLPPQKEQSRIVARIESLFAKLDEAKEKIQEVLDGAELRRDAILHQAFTGKLTAKWRKETGVSVDSWLNVKTQDVCEKIVCGKTPKEFISLEGEVPFLKVFNIVNNKVDFAGNKQYIPKEISDKKLKSSILKPNDIIMNIVGPPLRKIAIIPNDYGEWNMNQAIVRFRPKDVLNYQYLYYALLYPKTLDEVIKKTRGVVGQANISITQSRNLMIPLPTLPEQQEIVRLLDNLLSREQFTVTACEEALTTIDTLKKSILARAFRGELGTNDSAEPSAKELLQEILAS